MRTLLAVMLFVVAVSLCHAQETKKSEYTVSVDTSKVNLGQQVDQVAEALKKHLDGPMGMYYQASVRRNIVVGWFDVIFGLVLVGVAGLLCRFSWVLSIKAKSADCYDDFPPMLGAVFSGVGAIVAFIAGIVIITAQVELVLAPEYVALGDILAKMGAIVN